MGRAIAPALTIVGAAVGSILGPTGTAIGAAVGGLAGSLIAQAFFTESTKVEGPRLGDLTVTNSAYGSYIGQIYGTVRTSGQVIWATPIKEQKQTDTNRSGGGKGGMSSGSSTQTVTYSYFGNFAVAFGRGTAAGVLRMWADGKLIYDKTGGAKTVIKRKSLRFRFYPGDDEQLPDPLIEKDKGVGKVPAHRGLCYIVFERLPLANFGNRIPNVTAEIAFTIAPSQPVARFVPLAVPPYSSNFVSTLCAIDPSRSAGYLFDDTRNPNVIRRFNLQTLQEEFQAEVAGWGFPTQFLFWAAGVMGDGSLLRGVNAANIGPVMRIDPDTLQVTGGSDAPIWAPLDAARLTALGPDGLVHFALVLSRDSQRTISLFRWLASPLYAGSWLPPSGALVERICHGKIGEGFGEAYLGDADLVIYRVTARYDAVYDGVTIAAAIAPFATIAGGGALSALIYGPVDDSLMICIVGGTPGTRIVKIDRSGTVLWTTAIGAVPAMTYNQSDVTGSELYWAEPGVGATGPFIWGISPATGEVLRSGEDWHGSGLINFPSTAYDPTYDAVLVADAPPDNITAAYIGRATRGGQSLAAIVTDICGQVGLTPADLDVSALTDTVSGYVISRQSDAKSILQQLGQAYFFDAVESDDLLRFVKRAGWASIATIPQSDLAAVDAQTGELLPETRTNEVELPRRLSVRYLDRDHDYQQGTQSAQRIALPSPASYSSQDNSIDLPIVLTATEALRIGERALFSAYVERSSYRARLPWRYARLEPTDVATVALDSVLAVPIRIARLDVGADMTLDLGGLSADAAIWLPSAIAGDGGSIPPQAIVTDAPTRLLLPDLPLLRDSDDAGGSVSVAYIMAGPYTDGGWPGCTVYMGSDPAGVSIAARLVAEVAYGVVIAPPGDVADPFVTDHANAVRVRMITGADSVAGCTSLDMLNGANAAAVGGEVLQFRDVAVNADGSLTLSTLLRGRRGTDLRTGGHGPGELVIMLSPATAAIIRLDLAAVGATRYFKAVTSGGFLEDAATIPATQHGNDLRPYAVVHQAAALSGSDIDLTWVRRTRLGGALLDGTGDVPLAEESEAYDVDIYDAGGATVLRTLTASSPTATYAAADIATDFGSTPSTLKVAIYQKSAAVGRGFGRIVSLPVA
jgi:hypothetical protein